MTRLIIDTVRYLVDALMPYVKWRSTASDIELLCNEAAGCAHFNALDIVSSDRLINAQ